MLLTLITGPAAKYLAAALAVIAVAAGYWFWLTEHDARLLAEQTAREQAAASAEQIKSAQNNADAIVADAARRVAAANANAAVHRRIASAPVTSACIASPAIQSAVDSLRQPSPGSSADGHPAVTAGMPGPAAAAKPVAK